MKTEKILFILCVIVQKYLTRDRRDFTFLR